MSAKKISLKKFFKYGVTHPISSIKFINERYTLARNDKHPFDFFPLSHFDNKENFIRFLTDDSVVQDNFIAAEKLYLSNLDKIKNLYGLYQPSTVSLDEAAVIYYIVRLLKPQIAVETGVSDGMSSLMILRAMHENNFGHLYSIDLPDVGMPKLYGKEAGWIVNDNLRENWTLMYGSSASKLPSLLKRLKSIDFFMHDSEHSFKNMLFEFSLALRHLSTEGVLLSDDVSSNNSLQTAILQNGNEPSAIAWLKSDNCDFGAFIKR